MAERTPRLFARRISHVGKIISLGGGKGLGKAEIFGWPEPGENEKCPPLKTLLTQYHVGHSTLLAFSRTRSRRSRNINSI